MTANADMCESSSYVKIQTSAGFLASSVTQQTGCGSASCPWRLEALPGQRINLTLYDFSKTETERKGRFYTGDPTCTLYASVTDRVADSSHRVCRGKQRVRHLLLANSHSLEVTIGDFTGDSDMSHFLIQFDGKYQPK